MGRALDDLELSDGPLRVGCFSNDRAENQIDKNQNEQQEKCLRHLRGTETLQFKCYRDASEEEVTYISW